jgi:hypothetical protein
MRTKVLGLTLAASAISRIEETPTSLGFSSTKAAALRSSGVMSSSSASASRTACGAADEMYGTFVSFMIDDSTFVLSLSNENRKG